MTRPYGVDPSHPNADLLQALMAERYGPIRDLEHERFRVVVTRSKPRRRRRPLTDTEADRNALALRIEVERDTQAHHGATA